MQQAPCSPNNIQRLPQQALLAQALASVANAIFITDDQGQIIWVNEAFTRLSGYSSEDSIVAISQRLRLEWRTDSYSSI